ncbi:MAG TPA: hypothetical protein VK849_03385, partial [Longimicrobiales bacterium]|nr:hypothetical protein [Longimicrobiales bacterium]
GSCRIHRTIGVPVALDLTWRPSRIFGLGMQALANLNPASSYVGLALALEIGSLRATQGHGHGPGLPVRGGASSRDGS